MTTKYLGAKHYQNYSLLQKICDITGGHPYSLKKVAMELAKDLGITWPLRTTVNGGKES